MRGAIIYLLAITVAEVVTVVTINMVPPVPVWGIASYILILVATLLHPAIASEYRYRRLVLSLALVPLIRIINLSVPLVNIPPIWWYPIPIIYIPLLVAAVVIMRILGYEAKEIGFTLRATPVQLAVGLSGLLFGAVEYLILKPYPSIHSLSWAEIWLPALIYLVFTGFGEEFIFRGVLQRTAVESLGGWGIVYVSLVFAIIHLIHYSEDIGLIRVLIDIAFVFAVALFFSWVVKKTGSLLGVTLSHGITNIVLFLIAPFSPP